MYLCVCEHWINSKGSENHIDILMLRCYYVPVLPYILATMMVFNNSILYNYTVVFYI